MKCILQERLRTHLLGVHRSKGTDDITQLPRTSVRSVHSPVFEDTATRSDSVRRTPTDNGRNVSISSAPGGGLLEPGSMFLDLWSGYSFMTYPGHLETNTGNYRENVASPPWAGLPSDCFIFLLPHNSSWRTSCAWSGLAGARALRVES